MSATLQDERLSPDQDAQPQEDSVRILLIDDDTTYSDLVLRYLAKDTSTKYELVAVPNALAGLTACRSGRFDCILVDYGLPDLSGTRFIISLETALGGTMPPTIVLTALGGEGAATDAIRSGATDFLSKRVVSTESLTRAIKNAVEKDRLRNAIAHRSSELQRANKQLLSKNDEIQRFYQCVSHEVKTPLTAAREFIAIVLDGLVGPVTEKQKEILTHARDSCDQIAVHFNDLIDITRLETKKLTLDKQPGTFDAVLTRCLAGVSTTVDSKNIDVTWHVESPLPVVNFDTNRIVQVLSNLLGNAVKFTQAGGKITLSVRDKPAYESVEIAVSDSGPGIAEKDLPRIFDRLYQVESSDDVNMNSGLGLGLSIAQEIVDLHGGKIWVESVMGEGSTFTFRLPVA